MLITLLRLVSQAIHTLYYKLAVVPRSHDAREGFVRGKLVSSPYWCKGHLILSEIAFQKREYELAYSSALAAQQLGAKSPGVSKLLAQAYLATGYTLRAEQLLQAEVSRYPAQLLELYVAALLALQKYEELEQVLAKYSAQHGSLLLGVTQEYLTLKAQGGLDEVVKGDVSLVTKAGS